MQLKAGIIGLGQMGKAIAARLRAEGVELFAWNRTLDKAREADLIVSDSPASVASMADAVILSLLDSRAVHDVMTMDGGLLSADLRGRLIIDTTTNRFHEVERFYRAFAEKGASYVEAPLIGSLIGAMTGGLTVLAGGDREALDRASPFLEKLSGEIIRMDRVGLATKAKLVDSLFLGVIAASTSEALSLAEKAGLDRASALEIFSKGAGRSAVLDAKREKLLKGDFCAHFRTSLMARDLECLKELASSMNAPVFMASVAKELFTLAMAKGAADEDFSSVYRAIKNI